MHLKHWKPRVRHNVVENEDAGVTVESGVVDDVDLSLLTLWRRRERPLFLACFAAICCMAILHEIVRCRFVGVE